MSEPPIYGNMEELPIYGNLDEFTNIYSDEDFEAAAARIDLPALPPKPQKRVSPKPQKRASWISNRISSGFQGMSMNIKKETGNAKPKHKRNKPKQKVARKERKETIELTSPANKADPPNPPSLNSANSNTLNRAPEPIIPKQNIPKSTKTPVTTKNKSNFSSKCLIILFVVLICISGGGVVAYFKYGKEIMCFIGFGECLGMLDEINSYLIFSFFLNIFDISIRIFM